MNHAGLIPAFLVGIAVGLITSFFGDVLNHILAKPQTRLLREIRDGIRDVKEELTAKG